MVECVYNVRNRRNISRAKEAKFFEIFQERELIMGELTSLADNISVMSAFETNYYSYFILGFHSIDFYYSSDGEMCLYL